MRPFRFLATVLFLVLAFFFLIFVGPWRAPTEDAIEGQSPAVGAYFNWRAPSSLFPPSAIISLTDDNSTFFLARPAAFGPLLPVKSLSGQIWIGTGFGDEGLGRGSLSADTEGELGCSDVPGWDDGTYASRLASSRRLSHDIKNAMSSYMQASRSGIGRRGSEPNNDRSSLDAEREDDGTDDHLHHLLPDSGASRNNRVTKRSTHADIQSLQESAEIAGKIVLLSRGGCGFLEKVKWVQRRGGIALIVGDDIRGGPLVTMYARGDTSNVTIPALFTSHTTAHLLSSLVPAHGIFAASDTASGKGKYNIASGRKIADSDRLGSTNIAPKPQDHTWLADSSDARLGHAGNVAVNSVAERRIRSWLKNWFGEDAGWTPSKDGRRSSELKNAEWSHQTGGNGDDQDRTRPSKRKADEGFVIGVHDWRDPDALMADVASPIIEASHSRSMKTKSGSKQDSFSFSTDGDWSFSNWRTSKSEALRSAGRDGPLPLFDHDDSTRGARGWLGRFLFSRHSVTNGAHSRNSQHASQVAEEQQHRPVEHAPTEEPEHDGLWITLTPTSMSSSHFFDTLLVLVVSPLVTLTVVYALLLLRSRIRRRRWRAPKSIVDQLPVRTYHTMPSTTTSSSIISAAASPTASATTPLLPSSDAAARPIRTTSRRRTHNASTAGPSSASPRGSRNEEHVSTSAADRIEEKRAAGLAEWRRKYGGRQRECVVCLEEYVDGVSRVMSLPCGHEFHAECITPWLITRRRTCPICKGDVVRSLARSSSGPSMSAAHDSSGDENAGYEHSSDAEGSDDAHTHDVYNEQDIEGDLQLYHIEDASVPTDSGDANLPQVYSREDEAFEDLEQGMRPARQQ